jgi:pimeloyl-ACP methyl ester carboxylesterase
MVTPYYGDLAIALAKKEYLANHADAGKLGVTPRVYCCGYDWRQDNAKSALRLAEVVDEALRDTGEEKVMLVVHSMGGLVARHYCRALGGESKVFAVYSVGSPMLGAPSAYTQLKHGAPGLYTREYFHPDADADEAIASEADNLISTGASLVTAAATAASAGVAEGLTGILGPVYLVLVLGAGRLLTRRETIYFARQIPSAYQLLPNAAFCNRHRNWNLFDPLNTGHPPSGYLIKFPTLLDMTIAAAGGGTDAIHGAAHRAGQSFTDQIQQFLHGDGSDRSNALLEGANSETIDQAFAGIGSTISTAVSGGDLDGALINRAIARILTIIDRATKSFLDCRNDKVLYSDIFTGFLDTVSLRGISAYNLEVMYRFDDSLTIQPREETPNSALEMVLSMGKGVFAAFKSLHKETDADKLAETERTSQAERLAAERSRPRAYVHPRTIAYASTNVPVDGGVILLCKDVRSNYDSNLVKHQLLPNLVGIVMSPPQTSDDQSALYFGDGTVPFFSARPPDDMLLHPLLSQSENFTGIVHTALTADTRVIDKVKTHLADFIVDWYKA